MKHGSLFSGIGGFDLAAEWMGWDNVFHCEWNPFGQRVLKHYWPNAKSYNDITQTDFTIHQGAIDILTGGFPCQPYSMAGKRKGKEDERHLWPEMLRAIREIAPRYIVGENVLGLVNWDGGLVFDEVQTNLESEGYEVAAVVIPAAAVNAPHGRDRVWFVAYRNSGRLERAIEVRWNSEHVERKSEFGLAADANCKRHTSCGTGKKAEGEWRGNDGKPQEWLKSSQWPDGLHGFSGLAANAHSNGQHQCNCEHEINASEGRQYALGDIGAGDDDGLIAYTSSRERQRCEQHRSAKKTREAKTNRRQFSRPVRPDWQEFPTQSPICSGDDGLPTELDGITFSKWRNESIKGYGNAIVPQVAYEIFKVIQTIETQP